MKIPQSPEKIGFLLSLTWLCGGACIEFYHIAWGTGVWLGQFSAKWGIAFLLFVFFCILALISIRTWLWTPQRLDRIFERLTTLRTSLGPARWIPGLLLPLIPVFVLQYTFWGIVFHGPYLRFFMAISTVALSGFLLTRARDQVLNWSSLLAALILTFGTFAFFLPLSQVNDYPFSQGWSEGNRLWDYSIMFGRQRYDYPAGDAIPVYLDVGRQFIGGLPFLIPGLTIWQERLWVALTNILPYMLLGWFAFRTRAKASFADWALAGLWAFTFVVQGPIHPPLLFCAIIVALAWKRPLWLAIILVAGASWFATISRLTWMFAPAMWAVMLEFGGATTTNQQISRATWKRTALIGSSGLIGGLGMYVLLPQFTAWISRFFSEAGSGVVEAGGGIQSSLAESASQGLLWYRLLPNATYGPGILIGLLVAVAPLVMIVLWFLRSRIWVLNGWQKLAIVLPLLAFLVVGLIVSTKIGGGGDLHNMDMFIIGLLFASALAWHSGGQQGLRTIQTLPLFLRIVVVAAIVLPSYQALLYLRPKKISGNLQTIALLADITSKPLPNPLPDTLPADEDILEALHGIRAEVERAAPLGGVLFIDQRQLLTFGYVTGVPLIAEYEKKVLIDKALSGDAEYFSDFYRDLASQRFSLIISPILHERIKTDPAEFGEENNDWVRWVSSPILCYYEPLYTLRNVTVQILGPRQDVADCEAKLPSAIR